MDWQTKLHLTDYEFLYFKGNPRIQDTRNRRAYQISPSVMAAARAVLGASWSAQRLIEYCINIAVIPHPYEEYE